MGRRTPPSEVFREWDAITFSNGRYTGGPEHNESNVVKWRTLYDRYFRDGEWRVPIDDAFLVATMGMSLGLVLGRYEQAVEVGDRFFAHPDIETLVGDEIHIALFWYGGAQLSAGRSETGCRTLRRILGVRGRGRWSRARQVLGAVTAYAETMEPPTPVPVLVRELAADALSGLPGTASLRRALAGLATAGEVFALLNG